MSDNDTSSDVSETLPSDGTTTETVTTPAETGETPETTAKQPTIDELQARIDRMDAALKKANKEAKANRLEADELKRFKEQVDAEKLSAEEKQELARQNLEKQLADLQSQHANATRQSQERIINYEVRLQAAQMGIVDPDAAARLLDWAEIEYDDESGAPTNVQALLNALISAKPYLKASPARSAPSSGGATNPSRTTTTASKEISWEMIAQLTPAEYAARSKDIQAWMAKNSRR
jgi:small-conductance mechanosensitive channel